MADGEPVTAEQIREWDHELRAGGTVADFTVEEAANLHDAIILAIVRRINDVGPDDTDPCFGQPAMTLVCEALD